VELLVLLADGLSLDAVARRVNASERTVRRRVRAICDRLGMSSTIQVVAWAARKGLV
jgi:DNA-binding NarL/FixJ family response regulator